MELTLLDNNLVRINIIDHFESLIWADRYSRYGDFEMCTPVDGTSLTILKSDYYLQMDMSEHLMIIEGREIVTNLEEGNRFIFNGRSLESILERRIIWQQTILSGSLQDGILRLLNENAISPANPDRTISNLIFKPSIDPEVTNLTIEKQFTGDNLYDAIQLLCESNGLGFKITLNDDNEFVFELYSGKDRSYDQIVNPYVIFSPNFETLMDSNYIESSKLLKTVTLVAGQGEGLDRKTTVVGGGSGLSRRELYTDARDLSQTVEDSELTDEEYLSVLEERGIEKLSAYTFNQAFEGQADSASVFEYGEDFFIGDVVQIENEYEISSKSRVTEVIHSYSTEGIYTYPTFTKIDETLIDRSGVLTPGATNPANGILVKLKTVDGSGSGLDADLLDGKHASSFAPSGHGLGEHFIGSGITDSNDGILTGMYYARNMDPNKPAGVNDGALFVMAYSDIWICQMYMDWRTNKTYRRSCAEGVWSSWIEI